MQRGEEWVFCGKGEDSLLAHRAVYVVVLQYHVLLQHFYGVNLNNYPINDYYIFLMTMSLGRSSPRQRLSFRLASPSQSCPSQEL